MHFLIKIHIFGRNALNCALYLEFNEKKRMYKNILIIDYFEEVAEGGVILLMNCLPETSKMVENSKIILHQIKELPLF